MDATSEVSVDALKNMSIEEFLRTVISQGTALTVEFPDGKAVIVQPKPQLEPLPHLEGFVPQGWKDATYP